MFDAVTSPESESDHLIIEERWMKSVAVIVYNGTNKEKLTAYNNASFITEASLDLNLISKYFKKTIQYSIIGTERLLFNI